MNDPNPIPSEDALVGTVISERYRVERLLGKGAMGAVYLVEHTHMRKKFALKVLHAETSRIPEVVARFEREAVAAANIEHPNIAAATDFGKIGDGSLFLVLEYLQGQSLRSVVEAGRVPLQRALHIARQIADALDRVHAMGIVHRDLKPDNVMIIQRGDDDSFVKVLDFGIAKVPVDNVGSASPGKVLTQLGVVFGTPDYMAPEQAIGEVVDARADLYALGVTLYEMLTGRLPFASDDVMALLQKHLLEVQEPMHVVAPDANIPASVEAIVSRLMEKLRENRYESAKQVVEAIDHAAAMEGIEFLSARSVPEATVSARGSMDDLLLGSQATLPFVAGPEADRSARARILETTRAVAGSLSRPYKVFGAVAAILVICALIAFAIVRGNPVSLLTRTNVPPLETIAAAQRSGPTAVEALAKQYPGDARILHALVRAYAAKQQNAEAVRATRDLLKLDSHAADDDEILRVLTTAAGSSEDASLAIDLLSQDLGARGVDALLDLSMKPGAARKRAQESLGKPGVRERASQAALITIDLRAASGCEAKRALLVRAKEHGDARTLSILRPLTATNGCGFLGLEDCWRCMRSDTALTETIAAIKQRP